jgi:integration host factor subunit alpha
MILTKADIAQDIYENCGLTKARSVELAETIFDIIKKGLESDASILISDLGEFSIDDKKGRKCRNRRTGSK